MPWCSMLDDEVVNVTDALALNAICSGCDKAVHLVKGL